MSPFFVVMLVTFALTLFTSAALLFLVELMVGKMILPLFGGTPAVWNTCMVFYQAVLLAGYAYAHATTSWLGARKQAVLHLALLLVPFFFFLGGPLAVNRNLVTGGDAYPVLNLLALLCASVGMPLFVVSTSAPLLQKWFAGTAHPSARDPYFLYGASNLGSMLGLLGYPTLVEPFLRLSQQRYAWAAGYAVLVALVAACAVLLFWSPRAVEPAPEPTGAEEGARVLAPAAIMTGAAREAVVHGPAKTSARKKPSLVDQTPPEPVPDSMARPVTAGRVLRWVLLALVPSSLMLGVTTYITMDLAPIPLLWVLPLGLYLLSFILVFSRLPAWVHKGMLMAMPLLVLLVLFLMLADLRRFPIRYNVGLHLLTLFVVSMVCHGELARDRPATKHLTGFYLWMSLGGVLGGLFNGLVAPVAFYGLVDYPLALLAACLLLPPDVFGQEPEGGRRIDLALAGVCLTFGTLLMGLGVRAEVPTFHVLGERPGLYWLWPLAALLAGVGLALGVVLRTRETWSERWLDLALPACLGVLALGLLWGVTAPTVWRRVVGLAEVLHMKREHLKVILTYGVPAVLCYTFVERPLRFGLGVGAILLATCFNALLDENLLLQTRSFFGVLRVEDSAEADYVRVGGGEVQQVRFRSLIHGTTLHGKECLNEGYRDEPLSYYHSTGPIGQVFEAYNAGGKRNLAVVGLGTGTLACYAREGQKLTFYDIDPAVRAISHDTDRYFTFVEGARKRGALVDVVMGDARLTLERRQLDEKDRYGILVVDAFSSDAIPIHLITREALRMYLDKLAPDGILAFHISNRYLDLKPVLANLAQDANLAGLLGEDDDESYPGKARSTWVMLAREPRHLDRLVRQEQGLNLLRVLSSLLRADAWLPPPFVDPRVTQQDPRLSSTWDHLTPDEKVGIWTDDYSNLLRVLAW